MGILSQDERAAMKERLPEWDLEGEILSKTFIHNDFMDAMAFVKRVAEVAERAFHHPDIDIRWNKVTLSLTTHDAGGLTAKDADLAAVIEGL